MPTSLASIQHRTVFALEVAFAATAAIASVLCLILPGLRQADSPGGRTRLT